MRRLLAASAATALLALPALACGSDGGGDEETLRAEVVQQLQADSAVDLTDEQAECLVDPVVDDGAITLQELKDGEEPDDASAQAAAEACFSEDELRELNGTGTTAP